MSRKAAETACRRILKDIGATLLRQNKHQVWSLPGGTKFVCDKEGRGREDTWKSTLCRLKKQASDAIRECENKVAAAGEVQPDVAQLIEENTQPSQQPLQESPQPTQQEEKPVPTKNPNDHEKWTEEQDELLKIGIESGMNFKDIAKSLQSARPGVTEGACYQHAVKRNMHAPPPRYINDRRGKRWTDDEDQTLVDLCGRKMSWKSIRTNLNKKHQTGRTEQACKRRIQNLRLMGIAERAPETETSAFQPEQPQQAPVAEIPNALGRYMRVDKEALANDLAVVFGWAESWSKSFDPADFDAVDDFLNQVRSATSHVLGEEIKEK